jgi:hypothetical protein
MSNIPDTIEVGGKTYRLIDFSPEVQGIVKIRTKWSEKLETQQLDVLCTEAAIKVADSDLAALVEKELTAEGSPIKPLQVD